MLLNVIQSAANFDMHSLADFFLGNMTEVMLNKTCGSLKAINSGLEFETVVSTAARQGNPDSTMALCGLVVSLWKHVTQIVGHELRGALQCKILKSEASSSRVTQICRKLSE